MLEQCKKWYYSENPRKIEWLFTIAISAVMLVSFFYLDTRSLTVWSVNLLDAFADGRLMDYYLYCYINEYGAESAAFAGPYFVLIPWAIWNIPIWLIQKYAGVMIISSGWMILWSKLFLVIVEGVVLVFGYKMTMFLTENRTKALWVVLLSASFPFTLIGVFYSGQSDIIVLAYSSIAVYYLLKDNNKLFLIFSALAIISKPFFLFPFIILVLYTEKNIWKIFAKFIIGYLPTIVFQLIYANAPMFTESYELTPAGENMDMLTRTSFGRVLMTNGSWFFLLFVVLCVIAYIKKSDNTEERNKFIIYFVTATMLLVLGFTSIQHYRPIYVIPFLFILFMLNDEWYRINIILETFYAVTTMGSMFFGSTNIFSKSSMENTLITKIFPLVQKSYDNIYELVTTRIADYEVYHKILASVSVACIVILLVINYPRFKVKPEVDCEKCERWIIWINMLVMAGVILVVFKIFMGWFPFI